MPLLDAAATDGVLSAVRAERERQDAKWGQQNHEALYWLGILMEEVGEAAKACIEGDFSEYAVEMVQVAAVAAGAIESFQRNGA